MNPTRLTEILSLIKQVKIAIIGDFAVDFYFQQNKNTSEISVETGKTVHWGAKPTGYLGGAGNVAKNLAHLGVEVHAYGAIGEDLFGREMQFQCSHLGIKTDHLAIHADIDTPTYSKPMLDSIEDHRIDFGTQNNRFSHKSEYLIDQLSQQIELVDWIVVNEQFQNPLLNTQSIERLQRTIRQANKPALADLRSLGSVATQIPIKVNEHELSQILGISESEIKNQAPHFEHIKNWVSRRDVAALVTLGEQGLVYAEPAGIHWQQAISPTGEIDTVGAGDMIVAAFSAARAAGASISESCEFATLCAHISIHKVGETGSASPSEIEQLNLKTHE
jgi:rfaE bifunctional protein kinase chain/domain